MPSTATDGVYFTGQTTGPRKSDLVYHYVKRRIILGEYPVMKSLAEHKLATELGCSQSTVREALMRLERARREDAQPEAVADRMAEERFRNPMTSPESAAA